MKQSLIFVPTLLLFIFGHVSSSEALLVNLAGNTAPLELTEVTQNSSSENLISATIKHDTNIRIGEGNSLDLPQGTRIGFFPNHGDYTNLRVYSLIVMQKYLHTEWRVNDSLTLALNCGRAGNAGASFIHFTINGDLKEGCKLENETVFQGENYDVALKKESLFRLTPKGELLYGQKVKEGRVFINHTWVSLLPDQSLAFYDDKSPYFFFLNDGEELSFSTQFGDIPFGQNSTDAPFPVTFFENGQISSGLYTGESNLQLSVNTLNSLKNIPISKNSPVRLHEDGQVHQVAITNSMAIKSATFATITRREMQVNLVQTLDLAPGDAFTVPPQAQLVIENGVLTGFTHLEANGLAFTYTIEEPQKLSEL